MNKLNEIFEWKRLEVASAKSRISFEELRRDAESAPAADGFLRALKASPHQVSLIAEVKQASPSAGLIRKNFDPESIAKEYLAAGADCLSVLTDEKYFGGSPENIAICKRASSLPILRKDFIEDEYQIYEAKVWGADAILLICAALPLEKLKHLSLTAGSVGLDVLVEVHNEDEAKMALEAESQLIGVNNRDLATFETDLAVTERIAPMLAGRHVVSESALSSRANVERVRHAGVQSVLIGTSFCASQNIERKVREVMGW